MHPIKRRAFLRGAAKTAAVVSASGGGLLLKGCSTGKDFDLLVSGGTVYDGSGGPPVRADVGISGGAIRSIGKIRTSRARAVVAAGGLAVAPGFIDVHEHTSVELLVNPKAESSVRQGVTTLVSGNCGESPFPLTEAMAEETGRSLLMAYGLDLDWRDARGFFERIGRAGLAPNYASFAGHGTIRAAAMGYGNRPPDAGELERMKVLLREAMEAGALGLSSGLEYSPGSFASTDELIALGRIAARSGGVYATHVRNEQEGILEAVDEALRIARETPIRLQISHLKIGYQTNWPKFDDLISRVDRAAGGVTLRADRYPYTAWGTGLNMFFPLWSREGTSRDFLARLRDPALQPRLRAAVEKKGRDVGSWDKVLISNVAGERNRPYEGMNILEASARAGLDPFEFMKNLLIEEDNEVGMITFAMSEDHLRRLLAHPLVGVGSDATAVAPYGPLAKGRPHPRVYGTFPRVLGRYVREEKVVPLEEMIRKMTSMPASHLGFLRRGALKVGWAADIVVFDPGRVIDKATWTAPAQYPEGIDGVIVNGVAVIAAGESTGRLPGKVLRRNRRGVVA
jgi:N-acyl-D-amino-acid deacylase